MFYSQFICSPVLPNTKVGLHRIKSVKIVVFGSIRSRQIGSGTFSLYLKYGIMFYWDVLFAPSQPGSHFTKANCLPFNGGISPALTLFVRRRETKQRGSIMSLFGGDVTAPKSEMIPTMCLVSRRLTKRVVAGDVNPLSMVHVAL